MIFFLCIQSLIELDIELGREIKEIDILEIRLETNP